MSVCNISKCCDWFSGQKPFESQREIIEELNQTEVGAELITEVNEKLLTLGLHRLKITFARMDTIYPSSSHGRSIRITSDASRAEQLGILIYELCKISNLDKLNENREGRYSDATAEIYAKKRERLLYSTQARAQIIIKRINATKSFRCFRKYIIDHITRDLSKISFDVFYENYISHKHKEGLRNQWRHAHGIPEIDVDYSKPRKTICCQIRSIECLIGTSAFLVSLVTSSLILRKFGYI